MESIVTLKLYTKDRMAQDELKNELRKILPNSKFAISEEFYATEVRGIKHNNGEFDKADVNAAYKKHIERLQSR